MGRLGLLLSTSPLQYQNWETVANIAEAALDKGHQVQVFLFIDGVYNPLKRQSLPGAVTLPKDRWAGLLERGASVMA